ncbi:putative transcriptional regulator [uncultured Pleomorphomonas sp.]|uniref:Putative transcriptional regulator n=1 Tax=uncultured Pleomorphomonas sp. TaxID=442121 RepID=A0A212LPR1_9HYPH|nr:type II toxin-antitoxin system PrlF family antitoxin [uncultured Pleomorphomonas sp.]SCM79477.1 putative transcriptional regulator [uncultured Pleomorphomonas sp.]
MITSKPTTKTQTTIPPPIRHALRLREGDEIFYSIEGGVVTMRKVPSITAEDPFGTFTEWDSDADRKTYRDL